MDDFQKRFNEADKKVHLVKDQWHYPIAIKYGFVPITMEAIGFVRSYQYEHPNGHRIVCATGYNRDYFEGISPKGCGLWSELEAFLVKTLNEAKNEE